MTGKVNKKLILESIRGFNGIKEAKVKIGDKVLSVCAVSGLANVRNLLEQIKRKKVYYDLIEVMNCEGGCLGGGGQPINKLNERHNRHTLLSHYKNQRSMPKK